jgi:DNA polymerase-4
VERLARELQTDLRTRLSLSASVGAAPYRIVAKIASDRAKPGGVAVVPPEDTVSFLSALPVRVVPGVGPKTEAILRDMGVERVGDLVGLRLVPARRRLGQFADELVALARGKIRESPIEVEAAPRQRSVDRTFARDESDPGEIARTLAEMAEDLGRALARETLRYQTVTLRFRWSDFTAEQRSRTLHGAHEGPVPLRETAVRMAHDLLRPRPGSKVRRVRTIALVASRLSVRTGRQSRLDSYEAAAGTAN